MWSLDTLRADAECRIYRLFLQLHRFDVGEGQRFFALWKRFVPIAHQTTDEWAQKVRRFVSILSMYVQVTSLGEFRPM